MRKLLIFLLASIILLAQAAAQPDITIEKIDINKEIIKEFSDPARFKLKITNNGPDETFTIYSLIGVRIEPREIGSIASGQTKTVEITANPDAALRKVEGPLIFEYRIKDSTQDEAFKNSLTINLIPLKDLLEISASPLTPSDNEATISIKNTQPIQIEKLKLKFESLFFTKETELSLSPKETKDIKFEINKDTETISAGQYIIKVEIEINNQKANTEGVLIYSEKETISTQESNSGLLIRKTTLTKTNEGNTQTTALLTINKNAISRLFTINSPSPASTKREGFSVSYTWQKTLSPGESFIVVSSTNYTFPALLIILIIGIGIFTKILSSRNLLLKKKVSLVRTKNREFALKITIHAKALKHLNNIQIIDHLPPMTKLYDKFGKKPDRIDAATRKLYWNIEKLNRGEARIFSYIIYSNLNIVGRFELPTAQASFTSAEGEKQTTHSNHAYFSNEKDGRF